MSTPDSARTRPPTPSDAAIDLAHASARPDAIASSVTGGSVAELEPDLGIPALADQTRTGVAGAVPLVGARQIDPPTAARSQNTARVPTTAELLDGFFARYEGSTLRTYRGKLESFAGWLGITVDAIPGDLLARGGTQTHLTVLTYRAWLRDERRLAPSTINGHLAAIHAVVDFLREAGLCEWMLRVRYEKARGYRDTRGPGLKALKRLLVAAGRTEDPVKAARDTALLRLLVDLGLRRGEVVGLDLGHVEYGQDGLPSALLVRGKGKAERERLTLPPKTVAALATWLTVHPLLLDGVAEGDVGAVLSAPGAGGTAAALRRLRDVPLFTALDPGAGRPGRHGRPRPIGARLTGLAIAKLLAALADRAGLSGAVRPHGIRHTAITALLDAGVGLRDVQRFSRHADVRTLAVYDDNRTDIAGKMAVTMSELV